VSAGESTDASRRKHAEAKARKVVKALVQHHSHAVRRTGNPATAYPVRSWWWDKAATDKVLADAADCLAQLEDDALADSVRWQRHAIYWQLGRFEEAEADLVSLGRPGSAFAKQIGQPLGLVRKRKFMHEAL
jgi:hypothetical protein